MGLPSLPELGSVRSGVKTYCEPQTPCAAQRQAPKDAVKSNADRVYPILMRFKEEVEESENRREQNCSRPETNALAQRCERIAPEQKIFCKAQGKHRRGPCNRVKKKLATRQRQPIGSASAR